jgi:hypothetical protein
MAITRISPEVYTLLLDAYRQEPARHNRAAKLANTSHKMATRAWNTGWTDTHAWARPIREVLEEESIEARAALIQREHDERIAAQQQEIAARREAARKAEEERDAARRQAVEARTQEGQMVRLSRANTLGLLGSLAKLQPAVSHLADQLRAAILSGQIDPLDAAPLMRQIASTVKDAVYASQIVVELERLHLGSPTAIIGVQTLEMTPAEAAREIEDAKAALDRARAMGLSVLEGGAAA